MRATAGGLVMGVVLSGVLSTFGPVGEGRAADVAADDAVPEDAKPGVSITKKWSVLYRAGKRVGGIAPLPDNSPIQNLEDFEFEGPRVGDPFLLGRFETDGQWGIASGELRRTHGTSAAVKLARAEDFELEGILNAEGLGGWFFLVGWANRHGYAIYNVTLKESGSPWRATEFRDAKGLESTHYEFHRFEWKGPQPFRLAVVDKQLNLQVGREIVAKDLDLPNYHEGDLILGTYDTRYGPKPVRVQALRIRAR